MPELIPLGFQVFNKCFLGFWHTIQAPVKGLIIKKVVDKFFRSPPLLIIEPSVTA
jgi:hypothetical protein